MSQLTLQQASSLALQHYQARRLPEAEQLCRQILQQQPRQTGAIQLLGLIAHQQGRNDQAMDLLRQAIAVDPVSPDAHYNLGVVLKGSGQLDAAIAAYRQAIFLRPDYAAAHNNLGIALHERGQPEEAVASFRRAIALRPRYAQGHCNLADALQRIGRVDDAIAAYQRAISLEPRYAQAHNNLGNALKDKGQFDDAITAYRAAIRLQPDDAELHSNLGNALADKGQLEEAIAAHRRAIAVHPNSAEFHGNLALALLLSRRFQDGWREYEWRWRSHKAAIPSRNFDQPSWDGAPLETRTILIHEDQGFGDAIQFVRYLPMLAQRGGSVIFQCRSELVRLMHCVNGMDRLRIVARDKLHESSLPPFDVHASLMSLPLLLDMPEPTEELVRPPYIRVEDDLNAAWRQRIGRFEHLKVGLAWAGSPLHPSDARRSIAPAALAPLLRCGADVYSLQFGPERFQLTPVAFWSKPRMYIRGSAQLGGYTPSEDALAPRQDVDGSALIDLTAHCSDFLDTAGLISLLDLVVSVDTAVAHLAGAMGTPTWLMVPYAPDWRWQLSRDDSPWYPSIKIFRQLRIGDWDEVIARVAQSLRLQVKAGR